jgi:acetyl esterase/lipase
MEQFCLGFLLLVLLLLLASLPPAVAQVFWFLRVGVPELGAVFFFCSLLPAAWLARKSPKVSLALLVLIGVLSLYSWAQAVMVARRLPAGMERAFPGFTLQRYPLALGQRSSQVTLVTETYKDKLEWDRYVPSDPPRARILFVHGGSWRNGTRKDYPQLMVYLAGRGYEVVSLTYRLSPEHPYPSAPEDLDAAIAALGDGPPLFLAGRSSGGHLALLAAYRNADQVAGVIGFYPPVDMVWSWENPSNPVVLNSQEALGQFLGGSPLQKPEVYREASPIHEVTEAGPPTLLIHGGRDCLVYLRQSQMLSAQLMAKCVPHYLLELPWTEHGGDITVYGPTGVLSAWAIENFIESGLRP